MDMQPESPDVVLILDPIFGDKILQLAQSLPIWIIASLVNDAAVETVRHISKNTGQVTRIFPKKGESVADLLARALCAIDEHHGEASSDAPYQRVFVYGAPSSALIPHLANALGLDSVIKTDGGFTATKRKA